MLRRIYCKLEYKKFGLNIVSATLKFSALLFSGGISALISESAGYIYDGVEFLLGISLDLFN